MLKLVIAPYFLLGMFMGVALSKHSSWHPGRNVFLVLAAIHLLLVCCGYFLAINSRQNGTQISTPGLTIGLGLAYVAGFLIFLFI
jgi:hypothetical protein